MGLLSIIKGSLLLVLLTLTLSACSEDNSATFNGTMILETRPVLEGGADKFSSPTTAWTRVDKLKIKTKVRK